MGAETNLTAVTSDIIIGTNEDEFPEGSMAKENQDIRFAEKHAGKLLLAGFVLSGPGSSFLSARAIPIGLLLVPILFGIILILVAVGGYVVRRRRRTYRKICTSTSSGAYTSGQDYDLDSDNQLKTDGKIYIYSSSGAHASGQDYDLDSDNQLK